MEAILEMKSQGKRKENTDYRISGAEDTLEDSDTSIKENAKCKKFPAQNMQEIWDTMKTPNLRIIEIEEGEEDS
jgi:hypothetical protein